MSFRFFNAKLLYKAYLLISSFVVIVLSGVILPSTFVILYEPCPSISSYLFYYCCRYWSVSNVVYDLLSDCDPFYVVFHNITSYSFFNKPGLGSNIFPVVNRTFIIFSISSIKYPSFSSSLSTSN